MRRSKGKARRVSGHWGEVRIGNSRKWARRHSRVTLDHLTRSERARLAEFET